MMMSDRIDLVHEAALSCPKVVFLNSEVAFSHSEVAFSHAEIAFS
jgi:hypothetical protein